MVVAVAAAVERTSSAAAAAAAAVGTETAAVAVELKTEKMTSRYRLSESSYVSLPEVFLPRFEIEIEENPS